MPGIYIHPSNRRRFIIRSASALAAVTVSRRLVGQSGSSSATPAELSLALLSDTHIPADAEDAYRGFKPWFNLQKIVPEVVAARPEGVIVNGDAARLTGEIEDYQALKKLLGPIAEQAPVYIGLGNHDARDHFHEVLGGIPEKRQAVNGKHVLAIEHAAVRVIVLDSLLYVNKVAGLLGKAQRLWLAEYLEKTDDRPVVLFVHHTLNDGDGDLLDVDRLFGLIKPHPKVKAIFYGHSHRYAFDERQGVHMINLPAVGYNFNDQEPVGWIQSRFHPGGVDLTLHAFGGNMSDNGRTRSVEWTR